MLNVIYCPGVSENNAGKGQDALPHQHRKQSATNVRGPEFHTTVRGILN